MIQETIALYDWTNGVVMIGVFGFICLALIAALLIFMFGGKKKDEDNQE